MLVLAKSLNESFFIQNLIIILLIEDKNVLILLSMKSYNLKLLKL
jgi:hypothetical protein